MYKKSESDISVCYIINRAEVEVVVGTKFVDSPTGYWLTLINGFPQG